MFLASKPIPRKYFQKSTMLKLTTLHKLKTEQIVLVIGQMIFQG